MIDSPAKVSDPLPPTVPMPVMSSRDLLGNHREIIIEHNGDRYRLRLTNSNKLILCK